MIKTWPQFKEDFHDLWDLKRLERKGWFWWFKQVENLVDDYPDWLKERIHGAHLPFGLEINISVLMKNRKPHTWDLIRKQGDYLNSDPEDLGRV